MRLAESRITTDGQISVPDEVMRRLGLAPGGTVVWEERDGEVVVRRSGASTFADVHNALFGDERPVRRSDAEIKEGIREYMRRKHARC